MTVWKRENLHEQMNALLNQTIKPTKIWIYHCGNHVDIDLSILGLSPIIEYQYNTGNLGYFGRFSIATLASSKYLYILDDDVIPSLCWLEICMSLCDKLNAIISSSGRIIPKNNFFPELIANEHHINKYFVGDNDNSSLVNLCPENTYVDFGCNSWFLKTEWLHHFWSIKPITMLTGEDIHLSASCHRRGIKTLVPFQNGEDISGNLKKIYGWDNVASWKKSDFYSMRENIFKYWINTQLWKPLNWTS